MMSKLCFTPVKSLGNCSPVLAHAHQQHLSTTRLHCTQNFVHLVTHVSTKYLLSTEFPLARADMPASVVSSDDEEVCH
jgi:hypothetical protein